MRIRQRATRSSSTRPPAIRERYTIRIGGLTRAGVPLAVPDVELLRVAR